MTSTWRTPAVQAAEAELAAAVERGREAVHRARQVAERIPRTRISDEDIRQIERAARGPDAPPELRALAERVARGELDWRRIVDGEAMDDPGVQAAMRANLARLATVYRKFEAGYTLDEVLASEAPTAPTAATGPTDPAAQRAAAGADDEPEPSVLKHSSW